MNNPSEPLSSDKVASLLRRWNAQVDHLELAKDLPHHRFDLQTSQDQSFSATRLRSNLERFFLVFTHLRSCGAEVRRLRSWENPRRTGAFCGVYLLAWISPIGVFHALVLLLIALILSPTVRRQAFPRQSTIEPTLPINPVEEESGGVEPLDPFATPLTPQERQEMLARDFTVGMSELVALGGSGHSSDDGESELGTEANTDADDTDSDAIVVEFEVDESRFFRKRHRKVKKAKVTRVARLERVGSPFMHTAGKIADLWEKLANGISPPVPFPPDAARLRMVRYLLPIPVAGILLSPGAIMSIISFSVGLGFFGSPLFDLIAEILDVRMPEWRRRWRDRHTMLDSAPTDLQVTIRLLRDAEQAKAPLRPPPPLPKRSRNVLPAKVELPPEPVIEELPKSSRSSLRRSSSLVEITDSPLPMEQPEVSPAASTSSRMRRPFFSSRKSHGGDEMTEAGPGAFHRGWEKVAKKATDKVRVATTKFDFSERMKQRELQKEEASASKFFAHRGGVPGHLIIVPPSTGNKGSDIWTLTFVGVAAFSASASESSSHVFTNLKIPIGSITALKKVSGLGWKGKMAYDMLVGPGKASMGGIRIAWARDGKATHETFRTIPRRDELFNRLASIGKQRFESI